MLPNIPGFEILDVLGQGGMGFVLRARDLHLGRIVALKLLPGGLANPRQLARFRREILVLAELRHPNIIRVHDAGSAEGRPYMVMEAIKGLSLERRVLEGLRIGAPPSPREVVRWIREVADALIYCHERGVVHRDVKPANVMLEPEGGRAILIDFGAIKSVVASLLNARPRGFSQSLSSSGDIIGTPLFMAPEQLDDQAGFGTPGPKADVWGLGATLFFAISGQTPFEATTSIALVHALLEEKPRDLRLLVPDCPQWIADLSLACLRRDPDERPSMAELAAALAAGPDKSPEVRPSPVITYAGIALAVLGVVLALTLTPSRSLEADLFSSNSSARSAAEDGFRKLGAKAAIPRLLRFVGEEEASSNRARSLILSFGAKAGGPLLTALTSGMKSDEAEELLCELGADASSVLDAVLALLDHGTPVERRAAARCLAAFARGGLETSRCAQALVTRLEATKISEEARGILTELTSLGESASPALAALDLDKTLPEMRRPLEEARRRFSQKTREAAAYRSLVRQTIATYLDDTANAKEVTLAESILLGWGTFAVPEVFAVLDKASVRQVLRLLELIGQFKAEAAKLSRPGVERIADTSPNAKVRSAAARLLKD